MDKLNQQSQHRRQKADHYDLHRQSAAVLRPLAEAYAKITARKGCDVIPCETDKVNIKIPWLLLRRAYEQWSRLIDEGGVK